MKMDEYLQKKKVLMGKQREVQDKFKELEEVERKAQEIREHIKEEKRRERSDRMHNFSLLGMQFRPWTLNDVVIVLFVITILVVGTVSFMPGGEVSSDVDTDSENFFSKLFWGFTVKSLDSDEEVVDSIEEEVVEEEEEIVEEEVVDDVEQGVDFGISIKYQESEFTTINVANVDHLWYTLSVKNKESFNIKCNIDHYVNNNLKEDGSIITVEAGDLRTINMREFASDASEEGLSKVKIEISCSDGQTSSSENSEVELLTFHFD